MRYLLLLILALGVGCTSKLYYTRIYDYRYCGRPCEEVQENINEEFDNIYKILNKENQ